LVLPGNTRRRGRPRRAVAANLAHEANRIGADGFVVKPFEIDDLLDAVARALA
jgi:FixJ family two-component response regulator